MGNVGQYSRQSAVPMTERRYSRDEVDAILGRAIERVHSAGDLTHEDLVAAAREVGIPTDAIETAASEVLAERHERDELTALRKQQWRGFFRHLVPYCFVNGMLITLNMLTTHFPWALFPLFGWGIGLVSHFMAVVAPNRERLERRLEWQRDRERRRQIKQQLRSNTRQLERDVGQGISALLEAAAQRIAGGAPPAGREARPPQRVANSEPSPTDNTSDAESDVSRAAGRHASDNGVPRRR